MIRIQQAFLASFLAFAATVSAIAQDSIPWITDLSQARRIAEQQQRMVLLHFWGDGCQPCQQLEANVFNQPELIRALSANFVPVKIHVQQQPSIASYYKINQIPTDIIVLPSGVQVFRTNSPANANAYIAMLDQVRANTLATGFQEADRVARNALQQVASILPTLPPRSPEEAPTTQSFNSELTASNSPPSSPLPAWRNATDGSTSSSEPVRNTLLNNEFVGPLDHRTQSVPTATGPRYANPYLNDTVAPIPATQAPINAPNDPSTNLATESAPAMTQGANLAAVTRENVYAPANTPAPSAAANPNWTAPQPAPTNASVAPQSAAAPSAPPPAMPPDRSSVQLPPGVPPLALDGYCPVTLMNMGKWEKGDARFGAVHRDRTYLFKSQIERDRFLAPAAADRFAPVLSGLDPVRFVESGQTIHGRREHGVLFDGQIFLFADEEALARFEQQPQRYVAVVRQAMANTRNAPPQR